jgi:hypothetical protein
MKTDRNHAPHQPAAHAAIDDEDAWVSIEDLVADLMEEMRPATAATTGGEVASSSGIERALVTGQG